MLPHHPVLSSLKNYEILGGDPRQLLYVFEACCTCGKGYLASGITLAEATSKLLDAIVQHGLEMDQLGEPTQESPLFS